MFPQLKNTIILFRPNKMLLLECSVPRLPYCNFQVDPLGNWIVRTGKVLMDVEKRKEQRKMA